MYARNPPASLYWWPVNKVVASSDAAVADIAGGASIMIGGFGLCGVPENLIAALVRKRVTGLRTIANNVGIDGYGMGLMLEAGMIASHTGSYVGENRRLEEMMLAGTLDVKLVPQGTLAEADPGRRRGHSRVLHADRRRHRGGRGQRSA